jgi:hypothetical protein
VSDVALLVEEADGVLRRSGGRQQRHEREDEDATEGGMISHVIGSLSTIDYTPFPPH